MKTFGQTQAEEWTKTLKAAYSDTFDAWDGVECFDCGAFCVDYEDALEMAAELADLEGEKLYDAIQDLQRACRELNQERDAAIENVLGALSSCLD